MILVAGATGNLGSEICRRLIARGKQVRALVRSTSDHAKVESLRQIGAEIVYADLKDSATLEKVCHGISTVITTVTMVLSTQPGDTIEKVDLEGQTHLVDAAREAGVSHFIYTSIPDNFGMTFPLSRAKRSVEQHLKESGLTYTILQPTYFMEAWLGPFLGFDISNGKVQIFGSGQNKISFISIGDVAQFAVVAVDNPAARNTVLRLGGPEALGPLEVIRVCEEEAGRKFAVHFVPWEVIETQKMAAEDSLGQSFAALQLVYAQGHMVEMEHTLKIYPVELTTVRNYARAVLAAPAALSNRANQY